MMKRLTLTVLVCFSCLFNLQRSFADPMIDGSVTTCEANFQDPGGDGNYLANQNITMTFVPSIPGNKIRVNFSAFLVELNYDTLYVYHGPDATSIPFDTLSGNEIPPELVSTAPEGELTFRFVSDGSIHLSGWEATVSCIQPGAEVPAQPAAVVMSPTSATSVVVSWNEPNTYGSPVTGYILERRDGVEGSFSPVFSGTNVSFEDSGLVPGTTYFYRLAASNANGTSEYSNLTQFTPGQMSETTVVSCNAPFLDPGGSTDYPGNQNITMTFEPANVEDLLKVTFSSFWTEQNYDFLYVYDGPSDTTTLIATLTGSSIPTEFYSSVPGGALTFRFTSDNLINREGWVANITCVTPGTIPPSPPTISFGNLSGTSLPVHWTRPNNNGAEITSYTLEQRTGTGGTYTTVFEGLDTTFTATGLGPEETYFFRVRASNVNGPSGNSNTISYNPGRMIEGSMVGCDAVFRDPGGSGNYTNNQDITMTFLPAGSTEKVKVSFNSFSVESGFDFLHVYDGPNTSSPLVASLTGSEVPEDITATGTGGELTFVFESDESGVRTGWNADISCTSPGAPDQPAPVTFGAVTNNQVTVSWTPPADNGSPITTYTLQQKAGSTGNYKTIFSGLDQSFTVSDLITGTTYFYRVKATNELGSSEYSDPTSECSPFTWYEDADNDGFGNIESPTFSCAQPEGYVANSGDCDDTNPSIYPGGPQGCTDAKLQQTVSFEPLADVEFKEDLNIELNASSDSGLPVMFSSTNPDGSVSGNLLNISSPGQYTITAAQPGNETYDAAAPISHTFCVNPPTPTIAASEESEPPLLTVGSPLGGASSVWYLNGDSLQLVENDTLVLQYRGKYRVSVTYEGCISPLSDEYFVDLRLTTGTSDEVAGGISVYPVPAGENITLSVINDYLGDFEVLIYSVDGKVQQEEDFKKQGFSWQGTISLSGLENGIYFLMVSSGDRQEVRRFVKE